jgi:hypothetical protein
VLFFKKQWVQYLAHSHYSSSIEYFWSRRYFYSPEGISYLCGRSRKKAASPKIPPEEILLTLSVGSDNLDSDDDLNEPDPCPSGCCCDLGVNLTMLEEVEVEVDVG